MKNKPFDAIAMMRKIRDRLGRRYYGHPDVLLKDLEAVRIKYGLKHRIETVSKKPQGNLPSNQKGRYSATS